MRFEVTLPDGPGIYQLRAAGVQVLRLFDVWHDHTPYHRGKPPFRLARRYFPSDPPARVGLTFFAFEPHTTLGVVGAPATPVRRPF
jgi:hypothetical protein